MFTLMDHCIKTKQYRTEKQFLEAIGFSFRNISQVRNGGQSFRLEHIRTACELTGANANWILGLEKNMLRKAEQKDPLLKLKEATTELEALLTKKKQTKKR